MDAWFTATSATCVTGLVTHDTYTFWSEFGQVVILILIQIGGIGFMTIAISALTLTRRKIGLSERMLMQESVAAPQIGGIVRMSKFVLSGTFFFEGVGAVLLACYFVPRLGLGKGLYYAVFHSISAFCNAGIDLYGILQPKFVPYYSRGQLFGRTDHSGADYHRWYWLFGMGRFEEMEMAYPFL